MEGGDAGGDAGSVGMDGADVGSPEQGGSGLTTTTSGGIPIAPVYAGSYPLFNYGVMRGRRKAFMEGCHGIF
jgi:hypothetical protein